MAKNFWLVLSAALASAFVIFLAVGLTADGVLRIERRVALDDAQASRVIALVQDLGRWPEWNPWLKRPGVEPELRSDPEGTQRLHWSGEALPEGHIEILTAASGAIEYQRVFDGFSTTTGTILLESEESGSASLVWRFERDLGKPLGFILKGIFRPEAERLFDEGLANLAALASRPSTQEDVQ